jgi:hypothetical protein
MEEELSDILGDIDMVVPFIAAKKRRVTRSMCSVAHIAGPGQLKAVSRHSW